MKEQVKDKISHGKGGGFKRSLIFIGTLKFTADPPFSTISNIPVRKTLTRHPDGDGIVTICIAG